MQKEELVEEGIIISSDKGVAEVGLIENENCEECSAKLFCKPGENTTKTIRAYDPFDSNPGDGVRISIPGNAVLKATVLLYGVPLLLLLVGILLGLELFRNTGFPELFSFVSSISLIGLYFVGVFLWSKKHKDEFKYAKIITVHKHA
jgi:sigma-E factor negative regulatory protein RseC